jgi:hypothetical protein
LYRATVGRLLEATPRIDLFVRNEPELPERDRHFRRLQARNALEERAPTSGVIEPGFPENIETFFDCVSQPPKRDRARRIKNLRASRGSDHANRTRLRKVVSPRQTTAQDRGSLRSELAVRIPPACEIHFSNARDDSPDLQKPFEIQGLILQGTLDP